MAKPTFYLVTPSYNQAHFITETLDSILTQKNVNVTVLVMDGGSQDTTVNILKRYGKRIQWVSKKDKGQSDALNKGLQKILNRVPQKRHAQTFVGYLNSDDYLMPDALWTVAQAFESSPDVAWVVGECNIVNDHSQPIQSAIRLYKRIWRSVLTRASLLILNPIPQPAVFWRLSSTAKIGLFNQELHYTMDYEYWLRLWQQFGAPQVIPQVLAAFRIHGAAKGSTGFVHQFQEQYQVATRFTNSSVLLFLQQLHNQLIFFCYRVLKS